MVACCSFVGALAHAEPFDIITTTHPSAGVTVVRIDRPNVKQPLTDYPGIAFVAGDRIEVRASGCVQTGGHGRTWKRYVDPSGPGSDVRYAGTIRIPGVTSGELRRVSEFTAGNNPPHAAQIIEVPAGVPQAHLQLGYEDDNYGDNGYWGHDDGTDDQCRNVGPASVTLTVAHGRPDELPPPRYNEVSQKSAHNAYDAGETFPDIVLFHRVHSVEIDLHHSKGDALPAQRDWFVYHVDFWGQDHTTCRFLSDCLRQLHAIHDAFPRHEIITVILDLKDDFRGSPRFQRPQDLDARIATHLPQQNILTPARLLARCPQSSGSLHAAVTGRCRWPTLESLKGMFAFIMTGERDKLDHYIAKAGGQPGTPAARTAFIAPEITSTSFDPNAIFFNLSDDHVELATAIRNAGFVSRVYKMDDAGAWQRAVDASVHLIATDKVNYFEDPWAVTHNKRGWPFRCFARDCSGMQEEGSVIAVDVASGDIQGSSDNFLFAQRRASGDEQWSAAVLAPSTHVNEWAKGCLMARENASPGSPYFAVCRTAADHPLSIQSRILVNGETFEQLQSNVAPPTMDQRSAVWVKLVLSANGKCAQGSGSADNGASWKPIGARKCFARPLLLRGIAVSSHDPSRKVRFLFGNVRNNAGASPLSAAAFGAPLRIGNATQLSVADGWL